MSLYVSHSELKLQSCHGLGLNFTLTLTFSRNTTLSLSIRPSLSAPESEYTVSILWTVREMEIPPGLNDVCVVCVCLLCHNPAAPHSRGECWIFQNLFTSLLLTTAAGGCTVCTVNKTVPCRNPSTTAEWGTIHYWWIFHLRQVLLGSMNRLHVHVCVWVGDISKHLTFGVMSCMFYLKY